MAVFVVQISLFLRLAEVRQWPAPRPPKRSQQPVLTAQSNSTATQSITPTPARNALTPPSNRPGLNRFASARTQPKLSSPAMSRSKTTKETRNGSDRHAPHHQQSPTQQSAHQQQQSQSQASPAPTNSEAGATSQPANSADLKGLAEVRQRPVSGPPNGPRQLASTAQPITESGMSYVSILADVFCRTLIALRFICLGYKTVACRRLTGRAFAPHELSSLIDEILSKEDGTGSIRCLTADDAQKLIDVIDEACPKFSSRATSTD